MKQWRDRPLVVVNKEMVFEHIEKIKIELNNSSVFAIFFYSGNAHVCWKGKAMKVNYNKLWKLLIDLNMSKSQLREKSGVTTNVIAKMGKNENVSTEALCKICKALDCQLDDIMELVEEVSA